MTVANRTIPASIPLTREAILRKVTVRLLPFLRLIYVLAFLDRANIGFAKAAFQADTGIGNAGFAFGASVFFLGYAVCEIPSNLIMHRVGARVWMARIMVTWGLIARRGVGATTLAIGGLWIAASVASALPLLSLIALCSAASGFIAVQPVFWTFPTNYLGGRAAAGGIAMINAVGALGGFVAPNVKTWAEQSLGSTSAGLYLLAGTKLAGSLLMDLLDRAGLANPTSDH